MLRPLRGFERFLPVREKATSLIRHGSFLPRLPLFSRLPSTVLSRLARGHGAASWQM